MPIHLNILREKENKSIDNYKIKKESFEEIIDNIA